MNSTKLAINLSTQFEILIFGKNKLPSTRALYIKNLRGTIEVET
jgi:hypothetical protein